MTPHKPLAAIAAVILAYLFGAFVAADFDVREWPAPWRFIVTLAAFIVALAVIATEE